jgi:hypothetical protein
VKRSASGGPYTTIASPVSPTYTDGAVPTSGVIYYYVVTAVGNCGESGYQGSVSAQVDATPTPSGLDPLPPPPTQPGCYVGTLTGWLQVGCKDPATVIDGFDHFDLDHGTVHDGIALDGTSSGSVAAPLVYGQVEINVAAIASETDGDAANNPGWSVQNNSNEMSCNGTDTCEVQFVAAGDGVHGHSAICIEPWRWPASNPSNPVVNNFCVGIDGTPDTSNNVTWITNTRTGGLQRGDSANVAGYAYTADGNALVAMVAQFSWVSNQDVVPISETSLPNRIPGLYSVVTEDVYGLAQGWKAVTGGLMGLVNGSRANFEDAEVLTRVAASNCQGDVSASGPTCPAQPDISAHYTSAAEGSGHWTGETNNLTLTQASPSVGYPNRNLAATTFLGTTNAPDAHVDGTASCLPGQESHLYIKDNDGDVGGEPSNVGGIPFWESPDIFVIPQSTGAPKPSDVAPAVELTAGQPYNVFLRVHNEFGCNSVYGPINVFVDAADPDIGLANWEKVTDGADLGHYTTYGSTSTIIAPAYGLGIIGPFPWTPGDGGHKCLLAAISASNETPPSASPNPPVLPPAYISNQIAQRNVQIGSSCTFSISNQSSASANLLLGINVTPATPIPGSSGGPAISLVFYDPSGAWATEWQGLAGLSSVTNDGASTTVTLGSSYVALTSVPLAAGQSPSVSLNITPSADSSPTVNISALLTDPQTGDILQENGGSCARTQPGVIY